MKKTKLSILPRRSAKTHGEGRKTERPQRKKHEPRSTKRRKETQKKEKKKSKKEENNILLKRKRSNFHRKYTAPNENPKRKKSHGKDSETQIDRRRHKTKLYSLSFVFLSWLFSQTHPVPTLFTVINITDHTHTSHNKSFFLLSLSSSSYSKSFHYFCQNNNNNNTPQHTKQITSHITKFYQHSLWTGESARWREEKGEMGVGTRHNDGKLEDDDDDGGWRRRQTRKERRNTHRTTT